VARRRCALLKAPAFASSCSQDGSKNLGNHVTIFYLHTCFIGDTVALEHGELRFGSRLTYENKEDLS